LKTKRSTGLIPIEDIQEIDYNGHVTVMSHSHMIS